MPKGKTKSQSQVIKTKPSQGRSQNNKRSRVSTEDTDDAQNKPVSPVRTKVTRARSAKEQPLIDSSNLKNAKDKQLESTDEKLGTETENSCPVTLQAKENDNVTINAITKQIQSEQGPSPRWGHSFSLIEDEKAILIGGQGAKQQFSKDSSWLYDLVGKQWTNPKTQFDGMNPELRVGHSASYDPAVRCIYIYGGSKNKRWFNDVHALDLEEYKWQLIKTQGNAPTRAYHTSTLYRHELWIFGGIFPQPDPQPDGSSNDIHIYSPLTESWYMPIVTGSERPQPRSGHSATLISDELVVFGGWDFPYCFNDIYILDMSIVEWTKPEVNGTPPTPRSWHSACRLRGNQILIHGGYNGNVALSDTAGFNVDTKTWFNVKTDPLLISRAGLDIICLPNHNEKKSDSDDIVIFGGGDNDGNFYDDLVELNVPYGRLKSQ